MALTFWQSQDQEQEQGDNKTKRRKQKKDRSSKKKDKEGKEPISNGDLNKDGLMPPTGTEARESRSPGGDDLCFPCLPGLEDEPKPTERDKRNEKRKNEPDPVVMGSPVPEPQDYWLMRLFQSNLFDMSIAIGYLFNAKEPDVQAYLCQKLFVSAICYSRVMCSEDCQIIKLSHVVCMVNVIYNTTTLLLLMHLLNSGASLS